MANKAAKTSSKHMLLIENAGLLSDNS